jgi:hypothetical protein
MANLHSNRGVRPKTCKPVGPFHVLACPRIMLATKGVTDLPRERVRDLAASVLSSPRNHKDKAVAMAGEGSPPHDRSSIENSYFVRREYRTAKDVASPTCLIRVRAALPAASADRPLLPQLQAS